jgi:hypothetical protein
LNAEVQQVAQQNLDVHQNAQQQQQAAQWLGLAIKNSWEAGQEP